MQLVDAVLLSHQDACQVRATAQAALVDLAHATILCDDRTAAVTGPRDR